MNARYFLEKLQNILTCYSIRNSSVGYCQGFNFIVSKLLEVILDEVYAILLLLYNIFRVL